jgi:hypothetical protein
MKRRDFLKRFAGAGLAVAAPALGWREASAAVEPYVGPALITVFAPGGWDHSSFCDPRQNPAVNHWANTAPAGSAGNLRYAPMAENAEFFAKHYQRMLVINGIDLQTNGHDAASLTQNTGSLSGLPMTNALFAAVKGAGLPMPWLIDGGETANQGVQPFTRVPSDTQMRQLANPNQKDATRLFFRQSDISIIEKYRRERLELLRSAPAALPYTLRKLNELEEARTSRGLMDQLAAALPATIDTLDLKGGSDAKISTVHRILVAIKSGICVTASLGVRGGFDTHSAHDVNHAASLTELTRTLDYLWTKAEEMGIADRLVVHVTSDVGRTPYYNANDGKDHWSLGSSVIMMNNQPWTNRVVGLSGPEHQKVNIHPDTLLEDANGVRLQTAHVHRALRTLLGIAGEPLALKFDFRAPEIGGFFDPAQASPIAV